MIIIQNRYHILSLTKIKFIIRAQVNVHRFKILSIPLRTLIWFKFHQKYANHLMRKCRHELCPPWIRIHPNNERPILIHNAWITFSACQTQWIFTFFTCEPCYVISKITYLGYSVHIQSFIDKINRKPKSQSLITSCIRIS